MSVLDLARPELLKMKAYSSARTEASGGEVFLNANESAWPSYGEKGPFHRYPDPQPAALLEQFGARIEPLSLEDNFAVAVERDKDLAATMLRENPQLLQNIELLSNCAMSGAQTCLWLVRHGYDINSQNHSGQTVLHRYASWNKPEALALLLAHGADPNVQEKNWHATALGLALHHHHIVNTNRLRQCNLQAREKIRNRRFGSSGQDDGSNPGGSEQAGAVVPDAGIVKAP